jgi:hypothetical protein
MAMMSRGEFQCLHWVRGVRERPWTCTCVLICSCVGVIVGIDLKLCSRLSLTLYSSCWLTWYLKSPLLRKIFRETRRFVLDLLYTLVVAIPNSWTVSNN